MANPVNRDPVPDPDRPPEIDRPSEIDRLPDPDRPPDPDRLREAASMVEAFGRTRFPDSYTGLALDPDQQGLIVYRRPSASFDTELHHLVAGLPVTVHDARYSERELREVMDRLRADDGHWRAQGLRISAYGPRHDGSGIDLTTPDVELAQRLLPSRYDVEFLIGRGGPYAPYQAPRPAPAPPAVPTVGPGTSEG